MKKAFFSLFLFILLTTTSLNAQQGIAPNAFVYRWTWSNYQFPLTDEHDWNDYSAAGVEFAYVRHLNNYLNLAIPFKMGKVWLPLNDQGTQRDNSLVMSLDALLHLKFLKSDKFLVPYLLAGAGVMTEVDNDWKFNPEVPLGLGLNLRLGPNFYLSGEAQYRLDFSDYRNHLQPAVGLLFGLGGSAPEEKVTSLDADKDGVPDKDDQCPNQPGSALLFGCPDSDGDGVVDKYDECVNEAGKAELKGCPDRDGDGLADNKDLCPDQPGPADRQGCPNNDRDGDGVMDAQDQCPDVAGSTFTKGCPDGDNDGVMDSEDKCPTVAGLPNFMGCPDTDRDGIADPMDKCPNSPGPASNGGCPELKPEEKAVLEFAMKAVQFETGSARLLPESNKVLDEIAGILKNYPDHKLRIGGHTDSIGDAPANQALSEKRAKACHDYLATKGIQTTRMKYLGFGESKPIADNRFSPGREKNRRVEFEIYVE
jgi:outer membrane protein OmpA-like peptidoglycan-associated protein